LNQPYTSNHWPKALRDLLIILLPLALGTALFLMSPLELSTQSAFYRPADGWFLKDAPLFSLLYHYGNLPALLLSVSAFLVLGFSFKYAKIYPYRKIALWLVFTMVIGPGLIVNTIFKDHYGRPRPRQVIIYGGDYAYHPLWQPGEAGKGKSFPCGHATMGFYLGVPFFILRRKHTKKAVILLGCSLVYGTVIGVARIAQGGHFAGDVLWAAGFTYLAGWAFFYLLRLDANPLMRGSFHPAHASPAITLAILATIILTLLVLLATSYEKSREITINPGTRTLELTTAAAHLHLVQADAFRVIYEAEGHGFPGCKLKQKIKNIDSRGMVKLRKSGVFSELNIQITLQVPFDTVDSLIISNPDGTTHFGHQELLTGRNYLLPTIQDTLQWEVASIHEKTIIIKKRGNR